MEARRRKSPASLRDRADNFQARRLVAGANDERADHACFPMARQVAHKHKFPGLVEDNCLADDLAGLSEKAHAKSLKKYRVFRFGLTVVEDKDHGLPGDDALSRGGELKFGGNNFDFIPGRGQIRLGIVRSLRRDHSTNQAKDGHWKSGEAETASI